MHTVFWSCKTLVKTYKYAFESQILKFSSCHLPTLSLYWPHSLQPPLHDDQAMQPLKTIRCGKRIICEIASLFHKSEVCYKGYLNKYLFLLMLWAPNVQGGFKLWPPNLKDWCLAVPDLASFVFSQHPAGIFQLTRANANFSYFSNRWLCKTF